jgi:hypothetical protein
MSDHGMLLVHIYNCDRTKKKLFAIKPTEDGIKGLYASG